MQKYLESKVAEYSILFDWIESELNRLYTENKNHVHLLDSLHGKYRELQVLYDRLQAILNLKSGRLVQRAIPIIHDIEFQIFVLTSYIPGLQRESDDDLFIRNILLSVLKRCGLSWIEDILVRLDNQHAIIPAMTEMPIIFAPPQHTASTSDMAALYHELGHDLFQQFPGIVQNLARVVYIYFSQLRLSIGTMSPEKRSERNKLIDDALNYWNAERLDELFSDIYATFVCGPAHYFSSVDVAIRMGRKPFHINVADVHPPWAARIDACYRALLPVYENEDKVRAICRVWDSYASIQTKDTNYDFLYPDDLIEQLVDIAVQNIEQFVPDAQRYSKSLQDFAETDETYAEKNLEDILNERLVILLTKPSQYLNWERNVVSVLRNK
jgi:hypothetical protein